MLKAVYLQIHSVLERIWLKLEGGTPVDLLGSCLTNATEIFLDCSQRASWE